MRFDLNCDMQGGFVLIDQGFLNELDSGWKKLLK